VYGLKLAWNLRIHECCRNVEIPCVFTGGSTHNKGSSSISSSVANWPSCEEVEKVHHGLCCCCLLRRSTFPTPLLSGVVAPHNSSHHTPRRPFAARRDQPLAATSPINSWAQRRIAHGASSSRARRNDPRTISLHGARIHLDLLVSGWNMYRIRWILARAPITEIQQHIAVKRSGAAAQANLTT
jgi:hypothetical protein